MPTQLRSTAGLTAPGAEEELLRPESRELARPAKVLLVDGDRQFADGLKAEVDSRNHFTLDWCCSSSLGDAVERLRGRNQVDVILVNLNLPDSQGWDTYIAVRAQAPHVPIIILTEMEDEALALESIRKGVQDCLVKTECTRNVVARVIRHAMERCRAEDELRRSERRHRRLIASTTDYIYTVALDPDGGSSTHHGAACVTVTGYTAGEFEADPRLWFWMIHEQDRAAVLAQIDRVLRGITPPPLEHRILHKDGGIRWIKNAPVPHLDPQGMVSAYDGLISDITERKQSEERLKHALAETVRSEATLRKTLTELDASDQRLKATHLQLIQAAKMESIGTLAAGVAHEVKNPLQTLLMGLTYLAHHTPPENQNIVLALDEMRSAVKRADVIIRELLQLSAATRVEMHEDDLNAVVERSLSLIHYEALATQTAVVRQLYGNLPRVRLDRNKMEQVFVNLFLNACQAMPQGGTLTVRTWSEPWIKAPWRNDKSGSQIEAGETVVVTQVQDTGHGIPEGDLPRVFDAFFSTKPSGVGTGLGLSVVKNIIDLHGGVVGIENVAEGGVRVTLILKTQPEGTPQKMRPPLLLEGQRQPIGAGDCPV